MDLKIEVKLGNILQIYLQLGSILEYFLTNTKLIKRVVNACRNITTKVEDFDETMFIV
jgi:hypothetical protein